MPNIAVIHDYLTQRGGAERTALALARYFDAPLFTSVYQPELTFAEFGDIDVRPTYLQKITPPQRFRLTAPLMAAAFAHIDLSEFDAVIVSTSGFAHHVRHDNAFVYCHTPPRFLHDTKAYFGNQLLARAAGVALKPVAYRDRLAANRHANYRANSLLTAERIKRLYGKEVAVLHPPMRDRLSPVQTMPTMPRALVVARLQPYKRVDVAIKACRAAGIPLTIVGTGRIDGELKAMSDESVTFAGRVTDEELDNLFDTHSMVLVPGVEDFGLLPVEANHAGRPVVAQAAGGALETVSTGVNGVLVDGYEPERWSAAIQGVLDGRWNPVELRRHVEAHQADMFCEVFAQWMTAGSSRLAIEKQ